MKGWRFYEEFETQERKHSMENVIAVDTTAPIFLEDGSSGCPLRKCASAWFFQPNSPVTSSSIGLSYIQHYCKRVSEAKARTIHPKLFEYLEGGQ